MAVAAGWCQAHGAAGSLVLCRMDRQGPRAPAPAPRSGGAYYCYLSGQQTYSYAKIPPNRMCQMLTWPGHFHRPIVVTHGHEYKTLLVGIGEIRLEPASSGAEKTADGTGMIPGEWLGKPAWKQGVSDLVDTVPVRHRGGVWSTLGIVVTVGPRFVRGH